MDESAAWRWGVLVLVSFTVATCYYFYDMPPFRGSFVHDSSSVVIGSKASGRVS